MKNWIDSIRMFYDTLAKRPLERMKPLISTLFIGTFFLSCDGQFKENELYGYYAPINYKNTFDTIQLQPHRKYHRRIYDNKSNLVLEMDGKWNLEKNTVIHFDSGFLNLDRDVVLFPELLNDTSEGWAGWIDIKQGRINFCVGYHEGENCYLKLN